MSNSGSGSGSVVPTISEEGPITEEEETEESAIPKKRVMNVFTEDSLNALATDVSAGCGSLISVLAFAMYLNVPHNRIVNIKNKIKNDEAAVLHDVARLLFEEWRNLRKDTKDREKLEDIRRALVHFGKQEMADIFVDKYRNNEPITSDTFAGVVYPPEPSVAEPGGLTPESAGNASGTIIRSK